MRDEMFQPVLKNSATRREDRQHKDSTTNFRKQKSPLLDIKHNLKNRD